MPPAALPIPKRLPYRARDWNCSRCCRTLLSELCKNSNCYSLWDRYRLPRKAMELWKWNKLRPSKGVVWAGGRDATAFLRVMGIGKVLFSTDPFANRAGVGRATSKLG